MLKICHCIMQWEKIKYLLISETTYGALVHLYSQTRCCTEHHNACVQIHFRACDLRLFMSINIKASKGIKMTCQQCTTTPTDANLNCNMTNHLCVLSPLSRDFLEKLTVPQLVTKFPSILVTWIFVTAFKQSHHVCLPTAITIESKNPPFPPRNLLKNYFNIILPCKPRSPKWPLSLRLPPKPCMYLSSTPYVLHTLPI